MCWSTDVKGEAVEPLLSLDNPVMSSYAFYAVLLVLKMFALAFMTARKRMAKKVSLTNVWCSTYSLVYLREE